MQRTIAVVGATGSQGGSVVSHLLKAPQLWKVRALTRNTSSEKAQELEKRGVEVVQCDLNNVEQLKEAFKDAYGVFLMTNYWEAKESEVEQGKNMVDAAKFNSIKHVIWAGLPDANALSEGRLGMPHYKNKYVVENYISETEFQYKTYVYVGFYYTNFSTWFKPEETENGVVFRQPLTSTATLPVYDVSDTGAVVAVALTKPEQFGQGSVIPLVYKNVTMTEICDTITRVTGKKAIHEPMSMDEYSVGKPKESVDNMRWYNEGEKLDDRVTRFDETVRTGVEMKTLENWMTESKWLQ